MILDVKSYRNTKCILYVHVVFGISLKWSEDIIVVPVACIMYFYLQRVKPINDNVGIIGILGIGHLAYY